MENKNTTSETGEQDNSNFVSIKSEPVECTVDIKMEPPDDATDEDGSTNVENASLSNKDEQAYPHVENITVKIEPTYYSSDDELDLATYQNLMAQETYESRQDRQNKFPLKIPHLKKRRTSKDIDKDYRPPKKKKKIKEIVKKTYTTKAKKQENCYSENVTQQIELVTISEKARQLEYTELWESRRHMRYTCGDCALGFVTEEPYTAHMKSHAPEAGDFECDICRCRCRTEEQLYKHRLRHYRRYRCAICRRVHKDKETAASHVMSEHVHEAFTCEQCGKGFKRPAYLKKHVAQQHTKGSRHECPICARVFFHLSMFKTHFRRHNEEVRNPIQQHFVCDTCSRQFRSKAALRRHVAVHASSRSLACALCAAAFHTRRGLKLHQLNKHTDRKERLPQPCPHCERECTTPALLRQHIRRMHTDRTKKYQCDHCKRFYYTKGEVRAHIVWSHAPSRGDRALFCCGREFRTRTRLKDHVAIHHLKVERQRIHKCDQCEKAFANKQVLNRHRKSHSNLTYPCPECDASFKCEAYVKVHHQLKHLNMTRAQIKELKQARRLEKLKQKTVHEKQELDEQLDEKLQLGRLNLDERLKLKLAQRFKLNEELKYSNEPEDLSVRSEVKDICFENVIVKQEVSEYSDSEISVPLFDFADLKRD